MNWLRPEHTNSVKWSYRKLILWWALTFLSIGWIVFYTTPLLIILLLFCRFR